MTPPSTHTTACKSFFYRSGKHMRLRGVSPGDMSLPEVYMQHLDNHKRFKQCLAAGMKPTLVLGKPLSRAAAVPHPHTLLLY